MTTEQIIEEREDSIKMKMRFKRFLSGFMAVATLASTIIQPVTVSASELEPEKIPFEQQYAELKDVQDSLDPNEIVKATGNGRTGCGCLSGFQKVKPGL